MIIKDSIYGNISVTKPILVELLKSPSLLRLKDISQYGIPDKYFHLKNFSRYEHSVGVMLLLKKLGATLEEQVAGLLHDVSVLAFSHIADWVFAKGSEGEEDYHNTIHNKFVNKTEIPKIIKKYDYSLERLLDDENYSLLENNIPNLCGDRADYALRETKYWLNPSSVRICVSGLINLNGEMVFSDKKSALEFSINFLELQSQHWGGAEEATRYYYFSNAIKHAIKKGVILKSDFYGVDKSIIRKIENSGIPEISSTLKLLKNEKVVKHKVKKGKKVMSKFRYVNPKVLVNSKLLRLSRIEPKFGKLIETHRRNNKKGIIIPEIKLHNADCRDYISPLRG